MATTAEELVAACVAAAEKGADFPTVWHSILKAHPSVVGMPITRLDEGKALLEVPLLGGQRIVVGPGPKEYAVGFGKGRNAVV